ncbi:MerR family DNA-binding transcriptional regulator [Rubneribacter sp.]|nr:MerR family DNA-binding transcriptional regulator [Candidatus Rubneribacter avistercoris]
MKEQNESYLLSAGEVSQVLQISERTIRYYDSCGLVKPTWRNPENGYRYYSIDRMYKLQALVIERDLDLPIADRNDILIKQNDVEKNDYEHILLNLSAVIESKQQQIHTLLEQIAELSRMQSDMLAIALHTPNGPGFRYNFPRVNVMFYEGNASLTRIEVETACVKAMVSLAPYAKNNFGRVWSAQAVLKGNMATGSFIMEMRDDLRIFPPHTDAATRFYELAEGEHTAFLVRDVYNPDSWAFVREHLESLEDGDSYYVFTHELGLYESYENFRNVMHLVRLIPESGLIPLDD